MLIDGQDIAPPARLLVVDDTLFRGHTSRAARDVLETAGFKVAAFAFPVEIGSSGRQYWDQCGYPVFSIYDTEFVKGM